MTDYSDQNLIGYLQEAQIDQTPLTLHTGETSWPDVTIVGTDGGWVTIQCTFWRGNSGYACVWTPSLRSSTRRPSRVDSVAYRRQVL